MSAQAALAKLPAPLRDLVTDAAKDGSEDFGKSEKDKAEVAEWIDKVAQGDVAKPENFKDLEATLVPRTYLVSNHFTAADAALYGALHPTLSQMQPAQYYSHPAITRYFDHVQSRPSVREAAKSLAPAFSAITFDLENAPHQERKADPPKQKKETAPATKPQADQAAAPAAKAEKLDKAAKVDKAAAKAQKGVQGERAAESAEKEGKAQKKEKKAKEPKVAEKKAAPAAQTEDAGEPIPSMIDLRVGRIVEVKKHPDADALYIEQIDFGEETGPRTVVSGLVHYIPIEQMQDKILVGVCNLKPANMRGIKSFAMVLAATHKDGKDAGIELVQPPPGAKPGDRVYFEGFEDNLPLSQLNPKKKIFESIQPGFTTLETREAAWVDSATKKAHRIRTKDGLCLAPTFVGATLS